jgi:dTDP-4-dehydrorhamnose reductase
MIRRVMFYSPPELFLLELTHVAAAQRRGYVARTSWWFAQISQWFVLIIRRGHNAQPIG